MIAQNSRENLNDSGDEKKGHSNRKQRVWVGQESSVGSFLRFAAFEEGNVN